MFAAWRHRTHHMKLMRSAIARLMMQQMAAAFTQWREQAQGKAQRRNLVEVSPQVEIIETTWSMRMHSF